MGSLQPVPALLSPCVSEGIPLDPVEFLTSHSQVKPGATLPLGQ